MDHLKLGRSSKKKEVGKRRGLAIIYDGFNLVGNRIDIRDFRSRNPLQGRRNRGHNHPPHNILKDQLNISTLTKGGILCPPGFSELPTALMCNLRIRMGSLVESERH